MESHLKAQRQRNFRLPLLDSQGGNEAAEKKLSVRKEADRSNGQAFQNQPRWEQTGSWSQSKPALQPAPELAPGLRHKPTLPVGSCAGAPIFHVALERRAGIANRSCQECDIWTGRRMPVFMPAFPPAKLYSCPETHPATCKAHLGAALGISERGCPGKPRTWGLMLISGCNILRPSSRISNRPTQQWRTPSSLIWFALIGGNSAWQRLGILSYGFSWQQHWRVDGFHFEGSLMGERLVHLGSSLFPIHSEEEIIPWPSANLTKVTDFTSSLL